MSNFSSANVTDGNLLLKERTHRIKSTYSRNCNALIRQLANVLSREEFTSQNSRGPFRRATAGITVLRRSPRINVHVCVAIVLNQAGVWLQHRQTDKRQSHKTKEHLRSTHNISLHTPTGALLCPRRDAIPYGHLLSARRCEHQSSLV